MISLNNKQFKTDEIPPRSLIEEQLARGGSKKDRKPKSFRSHRMT